jgi:hypothetical protein
MSLNRKRAFSWLALLLLTGAAMAIVIVPVIIVHPFRPQTPGGLRLALTLREWSPLATMLAAAVVALLVVLLWRGSRWWRKGILALSVAMVLVALWFARQNHFEWMFNPLPDPSYASAQDATFVEADDYVLTVTVNNDSAAYPVRQLAYHHLVHDSVGGVPIVATY